MRHLSDLPDAEAAETLRSCCASARWVERMLRQRPFKSSDEIFESAERIWLGLGREDWLEAFAAHPRIGQAPGRQDTGTPGQHETWSASEQAGMAAAANGVKAELAEANREYERRFGWIYLVCATGKSAEEMLALAKRRMNNDPDTELQVAAAEQAKITRLRLQKLLDAHS